MFFVFLPDAPILNAKVIRSLKGYWTRGTSIIWRLALNCSDRPGPGEYRVTYLLPAGSRGVNSAANFPTGKTGWAMKGFLFVAGIFVLFPVLASYGQEAQDMRTFFPKNGFGGFAEFELAPPHNEIDLNRCAASAGNPLLSGPGTPCTAFARYVIQGTLDFRPVYWGMFKRVRVFTNPRFFFGNNLPQTRYSASFSAIGIDRTLGVIYEAPRNFEIRLTGHSKLTWLGKYGSPLGPADLRGDGPYGQYNTISLRRNFGTYASHPHE